MKQYTKLDLINELRGLYVRKTRERELTDQRYYIISVLSFEFKMYEKDILAYTNLTSVSSIYYAKKNCYGLYNSQDPAFLTNVKDLMEKYPYDFSGASIKIKQKPQLETVKIRITPEVMKRLKRYSDRKAFPTVNMGAKHIVTKLLKLWEE
jgi:guanylate kinase